MVSTMSMEHISGKRVRSPLQGSAESCFTTPASGWKPVAVASKLHVDEKVCFVMLIAPLEYRLELRMITWMNAK